VDRSAVIHRLEVRCQEASVKLAAANMRGDTRCIQDEELTVTGYAELIEMMKRPQFYSVPQEVPDVHT